MNSREINASNQYLREIEQGNLVSMGRASSLGWIVFVKDDEEYALHLQKAFRIIVEEKIFLASSDMFQPSDRIQSDDKFDFETFEWDIQGNNRYDERVKQFMEKYDHNLRVNSVSVNQTGDLSIQLSEKIRMEAFIDMSEEESWRFFKRHSDRHLVIGAEGIIEN